MKSAENLSNSMPERRNRFLVYGASLLAIITASGVYAYIENRLPDNNRQLTIDEYVGVIFNNSQGHIKPALNPNNIGSVEVTATPRFGCTDDFIISGTNNGYEIKEVSEFETRVALGEEPKEAVKKVTQFTLEHC